MILWTIQPDDVFDEINRLGVYRCDPVKADLQGMFPEQYDWLVSQMRKRIGPPPEGVSYPVWAWYQWQKDRRKPDLRAQRWNCTPRGAKFFRLEIDIPDEQVLLSDFDEWHGPLNDGLIADTEEEYDELYRVYDSLSPDAKAEMRAPVNNGWIVRGESIQATFWELRKEQIRKADMFISTYNPKRWS